MKRGILFAFLCAFTVGTLAVLVVAAAFVRPQSFQQLLFSPKLSSWSSSDEDRSNAEIVSEVNQAVVTVIAMRAIASEASRTSETQPDSNIQRGTGTGFIIDLAGLIV